MSLICLHNGVVLTGFAAMEKCAVLLEDGKVADVFSERRFEQRRFNADTEIIDVQGAYIASGFIDTHIHGFGGFGTEDGSAESLFAMSRLLAAYGVTAFNPTIYPAQEERLLQTVRTIAAAVGHEDGARIMGLHLEGPFISPSRLGVQRPETVRAVDIPFMERLWEAAEGHIVNMTVAPELKGMRELALFCIKKGIVLQAGHTDAKYENMVEGMQAGILHATHLFNAMSRMEHRNPNAVGAILIHPEMSCEIIADGFHVHPDLFKLLMRDKAIDRIVLVTDSLKPTEQAGGPLFANGEEVVFHDGLFHRKIDDVIAGSALTMIRGVKNLVSFGFSLEDAIKTANFNPAHVMRYTEKGAIIPGYDADITVFDQDFNIQTVIINGRRPRRLSPSPLV
ncbi:MAG: N-acetylglucosamine-6-phosphate deacetylase [Spirochaetaceae bacterium]|jgi:N-acetylglucosamine-6-phosphate deacetylase|nr:N-acetylglucosamine-6-phosphate deacetylase [Spirochaetaceae bacterium]